MTAFGKPFSLADLPERLQRQIREGATPRLPADPGPSRAAVPPAAATPPRTRQGPKKAKGPNKTEARYAREVLAPLGIEARYEGLTFRLANGHRYTPDWVYFDQTGKLVCGEVKGAYRFGSHQRARLAFDQARLEWPSITWIWATWTGKEWSIEK
jgi:hypothetical protein